MPSKKTTEASPNDSTQRIKRRRIMKDDNTKIHLILNDVNTKNGEMPQQDKNTKKKIETVQILRNSNINRIPDHAFSHCFSLQSVHFENGVTVATIEEWAFSYCISLTCFEIPNGVTTIGIGAFDCCTSLTSIKIPEGVITIGDVAFYGCKSLKFVEIPNGVLTIESGAFYGCTALQWIEIPDGVVNIHEHAFFNCASLETLVIPDTVTTIKKGAFLGCTSLKFIEIPSSVNIIEDNAFEGCSTLELRRTKGTNYHPDTATWLRQRFNELPIHRACYYANNTQSSLSLLSTLIQQNKKTITATDAMGMTPLHILCCNPNVTIEMVRVVVEGDLSVLTKREVTGSTPLQLFLKCRNILEPRIGTMPPLCDLLDKGIKVEDMDILLVLDNSQDIDLSSQDESTGLLPYMSAATVPTCGLDLLYTLAINSNLGMIS